MGDRLDANQLAGLGWTEMIERPWSELVKAGLPTQLESLARELGSTRHRPVRVFTMPMLGDGVIGLALPFAADDGIVLHPSVVSAGREKLGEAVAYELAYMLHPRWDDQRFTEYEEVDSFASRVAPLLLAKPPNYQWTDVAALASPRRATSESPSA